MSNNNNCANSKKQNEKNKTHQSSRFTPKIREYLAEMARDRESELERFMALSSSSPASSISVGAPYNSIDIMRSCSRSGNRCRSSSVGSGNGCGGGGHTGVATAANRNRNSRAEMKITQIPIVMQASSSASEAAKQPTRQSEEKVEQIVQLTKPLVFSASVEDLRTPTKCTQTQAPQMHTRKTQTPESALKSHKRLEWDSAADIGYRCERAMSTSNISTLERSVLEAVIQPTQRSNQSDTDLNRLQASVVSTKTEMATQQTYSLPAPAPLASSTFQSFNRSTLSRNSSRTQVTPVTRSTQAPSSTAQSSRRESCVTSSTASSFDYQAHHSRATSASSSRHTLSADELLRHVEQQRQEREYAAKLEQVLCNRQNKENQQPQPANNRSSVASSSAASSSSVASAAPSSKCDLDLGIDLLCSLVNKRSLSQTQKKQLVRDIAKRLALLDLGMGNGSSSSRSRRSNKSKHKAEQQQPSEQPVSQTQCE